MRWLRKIHRLEELLRWPEGYGPAAAVHLGKQQGNTGRSLANLPLVGKWLGPFIERKASTVRKYRTTDRAPDTFPALVMYAFTLKRVRRYRRMLALRQQGRIIIADRYPQLDVPSAFDGPDMTVTAQGTRFVKAWPGASRPPSVDDQSAARPRDSTQCRPGYGPCAQAGSSPRGAEEK